MEDPNALGGMLAPQPTLGQPNPQLKQEWDGWLQNPANRAGLLSFGLQMMSPTWGNQLAASVGAGAEAYTATQEDLQQTAERDQVRQENRGDRLSARADSMELKRMALEDRKLARDQQASDRKAAQSERQLAALMRLEASLAKQESDLTANAALMGESDPASQARLEQLKARRASIAARIDALDAATAADTGGAGIPTGTSVNMPSADAPLSSEGGGQMPVGTSGNLPPQTQAQVDPGAAQLAAQYPDKVDALLQRPDADAALRKAGIPYTSQQLKAARGQAKVDATTPAVPNVIDLIRGMVGY
jgi:hypothetical protein